MSLDSVELVMEFEKYFDIQIPDAEAEKMFTVQAAVEVIANHLSVTNEDKELQVEILQKINASLLKNELVRQSLDLNDLIANTIKPFDKLAWQKMETDLGLTIPQLVFIDETKTDLLTKLKNLVNIKPDYDAEKITVAEFIDTICAANYQKLINRQNVKSKYEIYTAVAGITVDKIGVDYFEIKPDKSFTNDLGVD
jgi:acyl carrier protein